MKVVLQRVTSARVSVDGDEFGQIGRGLVVFVGVGRYDGRKDVDYIVSKIQHLRVFEDEDGRMGRSVLDIGGGLLVVSQFTLYGNCRRGRRPSFDAAARPDRARVVYDVLVERLKTTGLLVATGQFQALMSVELVNDGPFTLILDSGESRVARLASATG